MDRTRPCVAGANGRSSMGKEGGRSVAARESKTEATKLAEREGGQGNTYRIVRPAGKAHGDVHGSQVNEQITTEVSHCHHVRNGTDCGSGVLLTRRFLLPVSSLAIQTRADVENRKRLAVLTSKRHTRW